MRRPFVAGNWKMNGNRAEADELVRGIVAGVDALGDTEISVCPPFILISQVADALKDTDKVSWGGQNLDAHSAGAYTGEISGAMLKDFACTYVIVGHSERRALYHDSNEIVAQKFKAAQASGLVPILCVGETLEEREADKTEAVIEAQLDAVVSSNGIASLATAVVAYEPVWAIGTGRTATPEQAQAVHAFIRNKLAGLDGSVAEGLRILYGGSVKAENATGLFSQTDIDGGLIGGASLKADDFLAICRAGDQ